MRSSPYKGTSNDNALSSNQKVAAARANGVPWKVGALIGFESDWTGLGFGFFGFVFFFFSFRFIFKFHFRLRFGSFVATVLGDVDVVDVVTTTDVATPSHPPTTTHRPLAFAPGLRSSLG